MVKLRSASKREALLQARYEEMTTCQKVMHKLDNYTARISILLFDNLSTLVALVMIYVALQYVHVSTDFFEYLAATLWQREPVWSDPPKSMTLVQFLELDDLYSFCEGHKAIALALFPALGYVFYLIVRPTAKRSINRPHTVGPKNKTPHTKILKEL